MATRPTVEVAFSGGTYVDVSSFVRSVNVRRGKRRELDDFDAGSVNVVLDNRLRTFDPTNIGTLFNDDTVIFDDTVNLFDGVGEGSIYAPDVKPRKPVRVTLGTADVFVGTIDDWDLDFDLSGDATAVIKASDAFTVLAGQSLAAQTESAEKTGARVADVLDEISWPAGRREIDTGLMDLGANTLNDNTDVIRYLQTVARSEPGAFFTNKSGDLEFRERTALQILTPTVFNDDGTGLPYSDIVVEYGSESLFTDISIEYVGGTATATSTAGTAEYGVIELDRQTFIGSAGDAQNVADFYAGRYSEPTLRIRQLTVSMDGLTDLQRDEIAGLEVSDLVTVTFTHGGYGDPITREVVIDQIEHRATPARYDVVFTLSESFSGFIIGSSLLGVGVVGF